MSREIFTRKEMEEIEGVNYINLIGKMEYIE